MIGNVIKDFKVIRELGKGGMATVFLVEHQLLGSTMAVKVLNSEFVRNEHIRKRFLAEARSMATMSHSNIIKVTDLLDNIDLVAFVMEYVEGETLKDYIERRGKLQDEEIKTIFTQMLEAVGYVHEQNLVHRDIKPSNFMIDKKGKVKLMDFGIAKTLDASSSEYTQTGTGMQMGTPMYMSPEQITETKSVTAQSDIYSLGVVLWQMATGQKPYDTKTLSNFQLQTIIVNEQLKETSSKWDRYIQKACAKNVDERFQNCNSWINEMNSNSLNQSTSASSDDNTVLTPSSNDAVTQIDQRAKSLKDIEARNEQTFPNESASGMSQASSKSYKLLKILTIIKILLFAVFLCVFYKIAGTESRVRLMYMEDWEYWKSFRFIYPKEASMVSFVFISLSLLYMIIFFKKLITVGHRKLIGVFRVIASIFMFTWSILLFTTTGHISVSEVQGGWYIYIVLEMIFNITTLKKINIANKS
jgi:serine/threonine-protein kinase